MSDFIVRLLIGTALLICGQRRVCSGSDWVVIELLKIKISDVYSEHAPLAFRQT